MKEHLKNLIRHMRWADSIHWQMFSKKPEVLKDEALFNRLFHIHFVQSAFLRLLRSEPLTRKSPADFTADQLRILSEENGKQLLEFIDEADETILNSRVMIPWFKDAVNGFSVQDALIQITMHTHYHRAQNAARFRELGGTPELTDYIVWVYKGMP